MTNREVLCDLGYEDVIVFENPDYDSAIIGVSHDNRVIYDFELMIEFLIQTDDMDRDEAADFIYYNTIRSLGYMGDTAPIIAYSI